MTDVSALWEFEDPAGSEARFRSAADRATGAERDILLTQVARALGLQDRFAEAHEVLDGIRPGDPEAAVRLELERGRLYRSSGEASRARPWFAAAALQARAAGLAALHLDALHMQALVTDGDEQVALTREAIAIARSSDDPAARDWDASLLNNLGMIFADAGDFASALPAFEDALAARERIGEPGNIRIARWMVAWALRNLGRREEALGMQRGLRRELAAAGAHDPYVDEELALLESAADEKAVD